ncbi:alpha/beta fold hydrolase [Oricola thermophila]|uniref:Alpha/beta hydrolase n=1 Tax=Oricola thermophila TaxID=2742145 RepID=A0A6N1V8J6_9HYPH|nr:alpha/beta hydrolase [Oricola thermophila]QKV17301.1 alpha/beta hydrolase [Oricola thermophila]
MVERRSVYVACGQHELHVSAWGKPSRPALVMWHGLARTGRDFDEVAAALSDTYFVVCPDTVGRGLSSWAKDVKTDYSYAAYGEHAAAIFDHFHIDRVRWVGTSMGGLVGVTLAAGRMRGRITHLVVNDIGPWIPEEARDRISAYVGNPPSFHTVSELEQWLRAAYAPFGDNSDTFWRRMADTSVRRKDDGGVTVHYDPNIVTQFTLHKGDLDCWAEWDSLDIPVLLLRGRQSDVLPETVAAEMCQRGPKPELVEFENVGHAPTLATEAEWSLLRDFLA